MYKATENLKLLCSEKGIKYVGIRGNPKAPLCFIGEAPGAEEDQQGIPFVGASGKELDKMLKEAGIEQDKCWFTNPFKCRPPNNDIQRINETGIPVQLFLDQFFEEIHEYKPPFLIPLGGTPLGILCGHTIQHRDNEAKISKWRGSLLDSEKLNWPHYVLPNFHPAYILREWSDRDVSVFIFRRLKEEYDYFVKEGRHQQLPQRQLIAEPSYDESREYLEECLNHDGPISEDIELLARRVPICDAFSYNRNSACSINLFEGDPYKLRIIYRLIDKIHKTKKLVGQNWTTFDTNWMEALGFDGGTTQVEDTLVRHHVLHPEMSHKLDFQVLQYTREPYYKDEGRGWQFREGMKKLKLYNCKDSACTLEVFYEQEKEFADLCGYILGTNGLISKTQKDAGFGQERFKDKDTHTQFHLEKPIESTDALIKKSLDLSQMNTTFITSVETSFVSTQTTSKQSTRDFTRDSIIISLQESRKNSYLFYSNYEMPLARTFHQIDKRGIQVDFQELKTLREEILKELDERCISISKSLGGTPVAYSNAMATRLSKALNVDQKQVLNIASVAQLKSLLKEKLHAKLKIDRHTHKETTGEESLNDAFASTGNPVLKDILRIRELNKILGTYVDASLNNGVFYSCYSVTGTVTGRRASRKNFLGFGSNGQNQPKHSDLGERFQGVFIARPNRIFVYCDQSSAEEWPVQGIIADVSGDDSGIKALHESMATGISRHARLAAQLFGLPLEKVNNKECIEYYIGKKTRHAGTYDMRENTMAAQMAAEGFVVETKFCKMFLEKFHEVEPNIRRVYHNYVQKELNTHKRLSTPLGRERTFHGLRPYGDNGKVYREGYAYIPQSTVGDNNGLAILHCETTRPGLVLQDGHDSCLLEVENTWASVLEAVQLLERAYNRVITFPNGFQIKIPIDFKIGFSIKGLKKCPGSVNEAGLRSIYTTLNQQPNPPSAIISGVLSQPLVQL